MSDGIPGDATESHDESSDMQHCIQNGHCLKYNNCKETGAYGCLWTQGDEDRKTPSLEPSTVERLVSLRNHFAGQALLRLMQRYGEPGYTDGGAVNESFKIADKMVAESERSTN